MRSTTSTSSHEQESWPSTKRPGPSSSRHGLDDTIWLGLAVLSALFGALVLVMWA